MVMSDANWNLSLEGELMLLQESGTRRIHPAQSDTEACTVCAHTWW